ncbi:hypothetical protein D9611_013442 [Ephemerocybe angulata]|uniref:Uncharacterized protein n=1 Tax=Ephemerocybe angulata TaxID=980116 RepID=A0A8H5FAM3_9AGAR|nr:hypothetical protein D9611_013442 [Tulosesus angulatus]
MGNAGGCTPLAAIISVITFSSIVGITQVQVNSVDCIRSMSMGPVYAAISFHPADSSHVTNPRSSNIVYEVV